jgi:hypothetical protein
MAKTVPDEGFLPGVLNSTPVADGAFVDEFADTDRARLAGADGRGTGAESRHVLAARMKARRYYRRAREA